MNMQELLTLLALCHFTKIVHPILMPHSYDFHLIYNRKFNKTEHALARESYLKDVTL
jgi:hypothetical protein